MEGIENHRSVIAGCRQTAQLRPGIAAIGAFEDCAREERGGVEQRWRSVVDHQ